MGTVKHTTQVSPPLSPAEFYPQVFKSRTPPEAIALCSSLLEYTPSSRLSPLEACAHSFFDELRCLGTQLPNNRPLPPLFNFSPGGESTAWGQWSCWGAWRGLMLNADRGYKEALGLSQLSPHCGWMLGLFQLYSQESCGQSLSPGHANN